MTVELKIIVRSFNELWKQSVFYNVFFAYCKVYSIAKLKNIQQILLVYNWTIRLYSSNEEVRNSVPFLTWTWKIPTLWKAMENAWLAWNKVKEINTPLRS